MAEKIDRTKASVKRPAGGASSRLKGARPGPAKEAPSIPYSEAELAEIFRRFSVQRPEPTTELEHTSAFTLLVAVVMSAQATDAGVNKATRELFRRADTPQKMLALGEDAVRELISRINFHRNKAKNIIALSGILMEKHGGEVPRDRAALEALPGVGRKTASVILNTVFGEPTLAVDTHILRLGNRLKFAPGKTPEEVEAGLVAVIPEPYLRHAHHWLILHGRYVCKARRPLCEICVIADLCRADVKTNDVPAPLVPIEPGPAIAEAVPASRREAE